MGGTLSSSQVTGFSQVNGCEQLFPMCYVASGFSVATRRNI
jgi:hypothetical protein